MPHRLKTLAMLADAIGVFGAARVAFARLLGSKRILVKAKGIEQSILVRMNNCDLPLLADVLCTDECEVDLPWRPKSVLDLGANIGLTAIKLKRQFPEAMLIAVEPDAETAEVCRTNLAHLPTTTLRRGVIGFGGGAMRCVNPEEPAICFRFETCAKDAPGAVPVISIAEILDQYRCPAPVFIKMDIEGAEVECFKNADSWLPAVKAILVEPHGEGIGEQLKVQLAQQGFTVDDVGEKILGVRARP